MLNVPSLRFPKKTAGGQNGWTPWLFEAGGKHRKAHGESLFGVLAQLVERLNGIEEVSGSIPLGSIPLIMKHLHERNRLGENKAENKSGKIR